MRSECCFQRPIVEDQNPNHGAGNKINSKECMLVSYCPSRSNVPRMAFARGPANALVNEIEADEVS